MMIVDLSDPELMVLIYIHPENVKHHVILKFSGDDIPGIIETVYLNENHWKIRPLRDDVAIFTMTREECAMDPEWDHNITSWKHVIENFKEYSPIFLQDCAVERFIREEWPGSASAFDLRETDTLKYIEKLAMNQESLALEQKENAKLLVEAYFGQSITSINAVISMLQETNKRLKDEMIVNRA